MGTIDKHTKRIKHHVAKIAAAGKSSRARRIASRASHNPRAVHPDSRKQTQHHLGKTVLLHHPSRKQIRLATLRRRLLIGVVVVAIIGSTSIVLVGVKVNRDRSAQEAKTRQQAAAFDSAKSRSSSLAAQKKFAEAAKSWSEFIETNPPKDMQIYAYKQQASMEVNGKNPTAALESYRKAEALGTSPDYGLCLGIAALAEQTKDLTTARTYYQKAIDALDKTDPLYEADRTSLQKKIASLG